MCESRGARGGPAGAAQVEKAAEEPAREGRPQGVGVRRDVLEQARAQGWRRGPVAMAQGWRCTWCGLLAWSPQPPVHGHIHSGGAGDVSVVRLGVVVVLGVEVTGRGGQAFRSAAPTASAGGRRRWCAGRHEVLDSYVGVEGDASLGLRACGGARVEREASSLASASGAPRSRRGLRGGGDRAHATTTDPTPAVVGDDLAVVGDDLVARGDGARRGRRPHSCPGARVLVSRGAPIVERRGGGSWSTPRWLAGLTRSSSRSRGGWSAGHNVTTAGRSDGACGHDVLLRLALQAGVARGGGELKLGQAWRESARTQLLLLDEAEVRAPATAHGAIRASKLSRDC
mmetsp:Transcript_10802/g.32050  ORF Transcript_10802/g.32050 Transcript_10802/m.32050 type:complete len:342 (+) Transcript_10802:427-1452(+)